MTGGWWRRSFPLRLGVLTAAAFAAVVVTVVAVIFVNVAAGLYETMDRGLAESARLLAAEAAREDDLQRALRDPEELEELQEELDEWLLARGDLYVQLVGPGGLLLARSSSLGGRAVPWVGDVDRPTFATLSLAAGVEGRRLPRSGAAVPWAGWLPPAGSVRAVHYPLTVDGQALTLVTAVPAAPARSVLLSLSGRLLLVLPLALLLVGALSALLARRAFRPIQDLAQAAEAIDEASLDRRLAVAVDDATLEGLVRSLNAMLARLEAGFAARRRFLDDASHELRTPLAALRTELELTLRRQRSPEAYRKALESALREVDHLIQLSEALLALARAGRAVGSPEAVRLRPIVARGVRQVATVAGGRLRITNRVPAGQVVYGDELALGRVVVNLLDNAVRACGPGGSIDVSAREQTRQGRRGVALTIADDGRGMTDEERRRAVERFYQSDREGSGRAGLGLAMVREIILAHHGQLDIDSAPGRGTRVTVWLPAPPGQA